MTQSAANIADIGMDTISLSGTLPMKLQAVRDAGFSQVMISARDLAGHGEGIDAAIAAVRNSGLRVTGFQVFSSSAAGGGSQVCGGGGADQPERETS